MSYDYNQNYQYNVSTYVDAEGNTRYRAVSGTGTADDPFVTAVFIPPNYATGNVDNVAVGTSLSPILTIDSRGMDVSYLCIQNKGSVALNAMRLESQVEVPNSPHWEPIVTTSNEFTNTATALNMPMLPVVRTYNNPFNLAPGAVSFLTLNIETFGGFRLLASVASGSTLLRIEGYHKWTVARPPKG